MSNEAPSPFCVVIALARSAWSQDRNKLPGLAVADFVLCPDFFCFGTSPPPLPLCDFSFGRRGELAVRMGMWESEKL